MKENRNKEEEEEKEEGKWKEEVKRQRTWRNMFTQRKKKVVYQEKEHENGAAK